MITTKYLGEIRPDVRAVVERAARAFQAVTAINHRITIHVAPAPAIRVGDGVGFGVTQVDTRKRGAPVHIAIAGEPPDGCEGPEDVEDYVLSTLCHEFAHYEQFRDEKRVQERGVEVRARNLRKKMAAVR